MLREGSTIAELVAKLGVDRRSWYRYVHRVAAPPRRTRKKRRANAISPGLERKIYDLDREGLTRSTIAARLDLHLNTVVKYLVRAGRRRVLRQPQPQPQPRSAGTPLDAQ
jgi:DNA-binding NarL/FixJ family response regulator